jgi:hypothetical protein
MGIYDGCSTKAENDCLRELLFLVAVSTGTYYSSVHKPSWTTLEENNGSLLDTGYCIMTMLDRILRILSFSSGQVKAFSVSPLSMQPTGNAL